MVPECKEGKGGWKSGLLEGGAGEEDGCTVGWGLDGRSAGRVAHPPSYTLISAFFLFLSQIFICRFYAPNFPLYFFSKLLKKLKNSFFFLFSLGFMSSWAFPFCPCLNVLLNFCSSNWNIVSNPLWLTIRCSFSCPGLVVNLSAGLFSLALLVFWFLHHYFLFLLPLGSFLPPAGEFLLSLLSPLASGGHKLGDILRNILCLSKALPLLYLLHSFWCAFLQMMLWHWSPMKRQIS